MRLVYLADEDEDFLQLADYAYESTVQVAPETLVFFGHAFSEHEGHARAIVFLERALEMKPDQASWLHTLAHSYEKVGDLESAVERMEKAADKDPGYLDCLGVLYSESEREDQELDCYQKAIEYDHDNAKAWNNMGVIYHRRGDLNKTRECCETALKIDPEFIWSLRLLTNIYNTPADFEKMKRYCLSALSIKEDNDEIWALLANAHDELGKHSKATQALERAIELNPENAYHYYNLGLFYGKLGESDKEVSYHSRAIEKDPEFVEAYISRGAAYHNDRADYGAAIKDFETAIAIQPSHALAHVNLGNALSALGKERKAQREYEVALELDPSGEKLSAGSLNNLAYSLVTRELFDKATEVLEIGLEKDPNYSYLYATKGLIYFRQGDVGRGRELYEQAISMSPDDLALQRKFHYEHGTALRIQGRFDDAIEELQRALGTPSEYVLDEQIEVEIWKAEREDASE